MLILTGYTFSDKTNQYTQTKKPYVDVNVKDEVQGRTALHLAIRPSKYGVYQNLILIENLLDVGADPLITDKDGLNAFDYADNSEAVYQILLKYSPNGKPKKSKAKNFN